MMKAVVKMIVAVVILLTLASLIAKCTNVINDAMTLEDR